MAYKIFLFLLVFFFSQGFFVLSDNENVWSSLRTVKKASSDSAIHDWTLNTEALSQLILKQNPKRIKQQISLPFPDGNLKIFDFEENAFLAPHIQAQFPYLHFYKGFSEDGDYVRFSWDASVNKFQGTIRTHLSSSTVRILHSSDSELEDSEKSYDFYRSSYYSFRSSLKKGQKVSFKEPIFDPFHKKRSTDVKRIQKRSSDGVPRRYRFAFSSTAEYTAFYSSVNAAFSALSSFVNSIATGFIDNNVEFQIVSDTRTVFTNSSVFTYGNVNSMLSENVVVDNTYGSANYDIGHVFGKDPSGGGSGIAYIGVVCMEPYKYQGASTTSDPNASFWLGLATHEVGHQYGCTHTFNSEMSFCNGNRYAPSSVEPGSGSTIMSYAGDCGSDDVTSSPDYYFHYWSLMQIFNYISSNTNCGTILSPVDSPPVVTIISPANCTIPPNTPFVLQGSAVSSSGNALTYIWEQIDPDPTSTGATLGSIPYPNGPLFRSFPASATGSTRHFPSLYLLLSGTTSISEVLPPAGRTIHFSLTARDNKGAYGSNFIAISVSGSTAFALTSLNTPGFSVVGCGTTTLTWTVGQTNTMSPNLNIQLSIDGGSTWSYTLAPSAPNDGIHIIQFPNVNTTNARVMVQAVESVFFAINSVPFSIIYQNGTTCIINPNIPNPSVSTSALSSGAIAAIVLVPLFVILIVVGIIVFFIWRKRRNSYTSPSRPLHQETDISLSQTSSQTSFSPTPPKPLPSIPANSLPPTPAKPLPSNPPSNPVSPGTRLPPAPPSNPTNAAKRLPLAPPSNPTNTTKRLPLAPPSNPVIPTPGFNIGDKVQAKYSIDGKFYNAVIDDIQGTNYLVRYYEFEDFQEWVTQTSLKK